MSEHNTHDFVGHEETDAEVGPLVRFAIFLTLITLACAALTAGFYKYLDAREQAEKAPRYPLTAGVERPLPLPPRLQNYPFDDVKGLRREEAKLLEHYQWVDKNAGTVRIPVERAIEILAAKGLPHRPPSPSATAGPSAPAVATPAVPPAAHAPAH